MSHVRNISDIEKNAFALFDVVYENDANRDIALKLVKGSFVFYPIHYGDILAFVPSKFIGYRDNTVASHEAFKRQEGRDGRETNAAINRILGKSTADDELDMRLAGFCRSIGVDVESKKHSFWRVQSARRFTSPINSAINDIQTDEIQNTDPEYKLRMAGTYVRDAKVRKNVLERAGGRCEYSSTPNNRSLCPTFMKRNGNPYLETHHVIKLSEQGRDLESNVIALCANHHREAHFGEHWRRLQDEFLKVLSQKIGQ